DRGRAAGRRRHHLEGAPARPGRRGARARRRPSRGRDGGEPDAGAPDTGGSLPRPRAGAGPMKIGAIALNTAREALRNKLLYSILAFACLVVAVSAVFGSASLGDPMKFVKDFSLM